MDKRATNYGVVAPEIVKSYDGLDFLKAIMWTQSAGIFWPSQFSFGLGLQWPEHT